MRTKNTTITEDELLAHVKAPDFPTGGIIYGMEGVKNAYHTGKGRVVIRGKCNIETLPGGRERIIVTEIPYQVNKAELIIKGDELVNDKKIEGISSANDESDRTGMRIVFLSMGLSFLYNVVGLSFAITGNLSPVVSAILMPLSSVTIVAFVTLSVLISARFSKFDVNS